MPDFDVKFTVALSIESCFFSTEAGCSIGPLVKVHRPQQTSRMAGESGGGLQQRYRTHAGPP